jgi:glycosyltransferase involved in cell wall biosynthesis
VIHNAVNVGTYACRNIALDNCSGEYITSHDSDDWAHPDRIKLQVEHLVSSPSVIGNMSRNVRLYEDGKFEPTPWGTYITDRCCVSFTFRSAVVQQMFGYWDSVRVSADVELVERIYSVLGKKAIHILPQPLIFQLRRKNSLTTLPETLGLGGRSSFLRQQYKEAYQKWHKTLHNGNCRLTFPMSTRPFKAPLEISVPYTDVNENLKHSISVIDHS